MQTVIAAEVKNKLFLFLLTDVQLSTMFDCCQFLLHSGLSEMYHPVQILADLLTLQVTLINQFQNDFRY